MQGLFDFLKSLGAARMAAMVAVTVALVGFFAFVITRATTPGMAPLFTDLSAADSGAILKDLERQGVPFDIGRRRHRAGAESSGRSPSHEAGEGGLPKEAGSVRDFRQ